jgi:lysophospholipid acyltransferase (LPLAT)-like uncharacterized protein
MKSWDATQIPKPFSTVALVVGEPFAVSEDATDDPLDVRRKELERRLCALLSCRPREA